MKNLACRKKFLEKLDFERLTKRYMLLFLAFALIVCSIHKPSPTGEWDDYMMPAVTLTDSHPHMAVYQHDIDRAAELFPQWATWIKNYMGFSPFKSHHGKGGMIPWYFPTYGIACIPLVVLLPVQIKVYAFCFTNFLFFAIMLFVVFKKMKEILSPQNLFFLILLVTLNPIIFYFDWISAEVFIYSLLGMALAFWYRKEWKKAALFISFAGSLNPTIMIVGLAVIADYFYKIISERKSSSFKDFVSLHFKETILFGCCFVYSLLPFVYAKLSTGKFSILISGNGKTQLSQMPSYFLSYFFDLNYGFLPYFNAVFLMFLILVVFGIAGRKWRFVFLSLTFFALVFGYCRQFHINCGISGIARYNAWSILLALFAFVFYLEKYVEKTIRSVQRICILATSVLSVLILGNFSPVLAQYVPYTDFSPIAKFFLNNAPSFYNPLHSTFNNRTTHVDGGYKIETPVVYNDLNGFPRKILASRKDAPILNEYLSHDEEDTVWLEKRIAGLTEKNSYISIPRRMNFRKYAPFTDSILFFGDNFNAAEYASLGLSQPEPQHTWTDGKTVQFSWRHADSEKGKTVRLTFDLLTVFNGRQRVIAKINGQTVFEQVVSGNSFEFDYHVPHSALVDLTLDLPDAVSPLALGQSADGRNLALAIREIRLIQNQGLFSLDEISEL